jgi:glyoxylase-like metal-dependent hydrolase (beta-lactamase superfamily II)
VLLKHRRREPAQGIFRLVLPLPFPGLNRVNAYLLAGNDSALVDCGIYLIDAEGDHGWPDLVAALDTAATTPTEVGRLIVTHPHIDHYGMAGRFMKETGSALLMHSETDRDLEIYRNPDAVKSRLREMYAEHGVTESDLDELTAYEDWRGFVSDVVDPTDSLEGGERFEIGDRTWEVFHTPGHSRAHICLWSASDRILISGDHLLPTITPHIDFRRGEDEDPLGDFLNSLAIVEKLDPALVLPGHGHPFEEGAERARVVQRHHDRRLGSILQVIRRQPQTASQITEEIFGEELLHFQRRLALGEALAHLVYLRRRGEVERIQGDDGTYLYQKVSRRREQDD